MADLICYGAQFFAACAFALVCELVFKRRYEPGYVWIPATIGIAQVGLIVRARLALAPVPALWPDAVAVWTWDLIFWSFVSAFIPIAIWQVGIQRGRIAAVLAYLKAGR